MGRDGVHLFQENDQVGRDGVRLFQENDQVGRDGVPLPGKRSGGQRWSPSSRRTIRLAEIESLFQKNDQVGRDGVPFLRAGSGGGRNGILLIGNDQMEW